MKQYDRPVVILTLLFKSQPCRERIAAVLVEDRSYRGVVPHPGGICRGRWQTVVEFVEDHRRVLIQRIKRIFDAITAKKNCFQFGYGV